MEERVAQFLEQAQAKLPPSKLAKEIATLRRCGQSCLNQHALLSSFDDASSSDRFIHRNQDHKFTEREKQRLFTAIQAHYSNPGASASPDEESDSPPVVGLIEDALKMPFTVFTTAHKQQMLRWLEGLRGSEGLAGGAPAPAAAPLSLLAIDLQHDGTLSLLRDDGEAAPDARVDPTSSDFAGISGALARGVEVWVAVDGSTGRAVSWREGAPP